MSSHPVWKAYMKGKLTMDQQLHLLANKNVASIKAEKMVWPTNPSSNMHEFIKVLEAEKR